METVVPSSKMVRMLELITEWLEEDPDVKVSSISAHLPDNLS